MLDASFEIAPANAAYLSRIAAHRLADLPQIATLIKQFEDADSPPRPSSTLVLALLDKLDALGWPQLEPGKPLRFYHRPV